jgi:hypothetical protein
MEALDSTIQEARQCLQNGNAAKADRLLSCEEAVSFSGQDGAGLKAIWPLLAQARRERRSKAATGRIDLHTHTTASDGALTVQESVCKHFRQGQILINDHNIIDSLDAARGLVFEHDLALDIFLGIEVICTKERRAFEFMAIAPTLTDAFVDLCQMHRQKWNQACELFLIDLVAHDNFFDNPLWQQVRQDYQIGGDFEPVIKKFDIIRKRIAQNDQDYQEYLSGEQTFDMGDLYHNWGLEADDTLPMTPHRFYASMRSYAMNAYPDELGDWFHYESLARRYQEVGCLISHNHPNYWDQDFIGELPYALQEQWIRDWAASGIIDALEVWSPPFASKRVPHHWEAFAKECKLIPMAGTDCHDGQEEQRGGLVENHPEIPPLLYAKLTEQAVSQACKESDPWLSLEAWRKVLEIDYAHSQALVHIYEITENF